MKPKFTQVLSRAATNTFNLVIAGVGAVGAAALSSWAVAAIGGAAYVSMVALDSANPGFWKKTFAGGAGPTRLPDPSRVNDPSVRKAVEEILAARKELGRVLAKTPAEVKQHLGGAIASVDELEARAARLVVRSQDLARYLATVNKQPIEEEIARLDRKARDTTDRTAGQEYANAMKARRTQLESIESIEEAKERLDANLHRIAATVSGLPVRIVNMRALDAQAMDGLSGDVNAELERMNGDLRTFEETLKTLTEIEP